MWTYQTSLSQLSAFRCFSNIADKIHVSSTERSLKYYSFWFWNEMYDLILYILKVFLWLLTGKTMFFYGLSELGSQNVSLEQWLLTKQPQIWWTKTLFFKCFSVLHLTRSTSLTNVTTSRIRNSNLVIVFITFILGVWSEGQEEASTTKEDVEDAGGEGEQECWLGEKKCHELSKMESGSERDCC